jgi:predicted ATP-grasp superfamily ATP-dependent carboligase
VLRRSVIPGALLLGSDFKALGVARSLAGHGVPVMIVDDLPRSAWFSRHVAKRFRWRGAMWGAPFVEYLMRLARDHRLEQWVLFPLQDETVETVARHAQALAASYRLVTPPWEKLRWAHDKRLANQLATQAGIGIPRTWYPATETELDAIAVNFPVIVKPTTSIRLQYALGHKALPASNRTELVQQYRAARAVLEPDAIMIQEVIPGDGRSQWSVAAFCLKGRAIASMTARRSRQYPYDYGLSSTFVEAIEMPHLIQLARRLLEPLQLSGMLEVEFKRDARDGQDKFLDLNVRPWGWHTLSIASGLDFPYAQYRQALGESIDLAPPRYGGRWRRLITDIPAGIQEIRQGWSTPSAYLRSLCAPAVGSVFDWRDPLPALGDAAVCLARAFGAGGRRATLPTR